MGGFSAHLHVAVNDVERVQMSECEGDLADVDASVLRRERAVRLVEECEEVQIAHGLHAKAGGVGGKERAFKANEECVRSLRHHLENAPLVQHAFREIRLALNVGAIVELGHEQAIVAVASSREENAAERAQMHEAFEGDRDGIVHDISSICTSAMSEPARPR
jgi:hypothetical protein